MVWTKERLKAERPDKKLFLTGIKISFRARAVELFNII